MTTLLPAPRPITPAASRRSWNEMSVRVWVIMALLIAVTTVYFTISQIVGGWGDRQLIANGEPLDAKVIEINGSKNAQLTFDRHDALQVWIDYTPSGAAAQELPGELTPDPLPPPGMEPRKLRVGEMIPIRVDRHDPTHWTDRTEPRSWVIELTVVWLLLPLLIILVGVAMLRRMQVLHLWRDGREVQAVVIDARQTAIAPKSKYVRMSLADSDDRTVFNTLVPAARVPSPGEIVTVILPHNGHSPALLAALYTDATA